MVRPSTVRLSARVALPSFWTTLKLLKDEPLATVASVPPFTVKDPSRFCSDTDVMFELVALTSSKATLAVMPVMLSAAAPSDTQAVSSASDVDGERSDGATQRRNDEDHIMT